MKYYFDGLETVEEIKKEYRRLAMANHPDRGGLTAVMQEINAQYHSALKNCHGQKSVDAEQHEHTYYYKQDVEQAIIDKLDELLGIKLPSKCTINIYLIGTWLWVEGDTKPIKDTLKKLGCMWHSQRVSWYWRPAEQRGWYKYAGGDLQDLADRYGAKSWRVEGKEEQALARA